jgi:hypothetical protein
MTQYLLSVHNDGTSPYATEEDMLAAFADTGAFNEKVQAAGAWVFAGGLEFPSSAKVVRRRDGALERTDGPYLETKEHIGGFWIIEAADMDEALAWAEQGAVACRGHVEVRPFQGLPQD